MANAKVQHHQTCKIIELYETKTLVDNKWVCILSAIFKIFLSKLNMLRHCSFYFLDVKVCVFASLGWREGTLLVIFSWVAVYLAGLPGFIFEKMPNQFYENARKYQTAIPQKGQIKARFMKVSPRKNERRPNVPT